jgi:hypothetical protein
VLVLEKQGDFLRDFRGDTIHASTLTLLDELGLGEEFGRLPHQRVQQLSVTTDDGNDTIADFRRLPGRFRERALAPVLAGQAGSGTPAPLRLLDSVPRLQGSTAYLVGIGVRPEHVRIRAVRRPPSPVRRRPPSESR